MCLPGGIDLRTQCLFRVKGQFWVQDLGCMFRIAHCRIESSAEVSTSELGAGRLHMHTEHRGYLDTFHRFRVLG